MRDGRLAAVGVTLAALLAATTQSAAAQSTPASGRAVSAVQHSAGGSGNLIADGNAEAGYCTTDWSAATTVPGWTTTKGSQDVVCYSVGKLTYPTDQSPGQAMFGSGPYGDSAMTQTVNVSSAAQAIDTGTVGFDLSGWLGGWGKLPGYTTVTATFLGQHGQRLGTSTTLPTVTRRDRHNKSGFLSRSTTGTVPAGTRAIRVDVRFLDSSTPPAAYLNPTGPGGGLLDNLSLTLSAPVHVQPLTPPRSAVPHFDHVFTIMMENTNGGDVLADTTGMPYFHQLMAQGTTLANSHGVYHPSDENYLAIAGGDTYATGYTYWPDINDPHTNIADEIQAKGLTWKTYEQGMGTPCNTTQAYDKSYYPDDAPFFNYTNVAANQARCQAHMFDTSQLTTDLKSARTTPNFAWVAPDDYYDGESAGDGNAASRAVQDGWIKQTVSQILASPAWQTQKSLLIITWDEAYSPTGTEAVNRVATVVLGSHGTVRPGYTSDVRYDHYSTARTIEEALGIAPITANDEYATPFNDAFRDTGQNR